MQHSVRDAAPSRSRSRSSGWFRRALVALPGRLPPLPWSLGDLRSRWWALVPAGSIVVVIAVINSTPARRPRSPTWPWSAVPPLAALALGGWSAGRGPAWALAAVPLFALAWAAPGSLAGEAAATALSALACIALGWLLVSVVPALWLRLGDLRDGGDRHLARRHRPAAGPELGPQRRPPGRRPAPPAGGPLRLRRDGLRRPLRRRPGRLPPRTSADRPKTSDMAAFRPIGSVRGRSGRGAGAGVRPALLRRRRRCRRRCRSRSRWRWCSALGARDARTGRSPRRPRRGGPRA